MFVQYTETQKKKIIKLYKSKGIMETSRITRVSIPTIYKWVNSNKKTVSKFRRIRSTKKKK